MIQAMQCWLGHIRQSFLYKLDSWLNDSGNVGLVEPYKTCNSVLALESCLSESGNVNLVVLNKISLTVLDKSSFSILKKHDIDLMIQAM